MRSMEGAGGSPEQEKPNGERWLEMIGYGHLKGQPTGHFKAGRPIMAEEFDQLCGDHAAPIFAEIERRGPDDPRYGLYISAARKAFDGYFGSTEAASSE